MVISERGRQLLQSTMNQLINGRLRIDNPDAAIEEVDSLSRAVGAVIGGFLTREDHEQKRMITEFLQAYEYTYNQEQAKAR